MLILVLVALAFGANTAYYDKLGVAPNATSRQIRKAFNKLSMLYHPDKHPDRR